MLWTYQQRLDPLHNLLPWSPVWSTVLAAVPVVVLFWLLVPRRWLAPKAAAAGAVAALTVAILGYGMPALSAFMAFLYGVGFGLLPVGLTIFSAMLLYNITVETGHFAVVRRSVAGLSGDARIQAVLIGFAFGAFLEGAAGGGTPVAICGAIMVGLGFDPFLSAVLCLIANTSPVAYGGLGTPLIVLGGVAHLDTFTLSQMAGRQLPLLSCIVPLWMVRVMCNWRQTFAVWPALAVAGGSFAGFQLVFSHSKTLYNMTDIGGGVFSLVVTALFLRFCWKPREEWHFHGTKSLSLVGSSPPPCDTGGAQAPVIADLPPTKPEPPLTPGRVALAWTPFGIMCVLLLLFGVVRQFEGQWKAAYLKDHTPIPSFLGVQSIYLIHVPFLDGQSFRDPQLQEDPSAEPKPETAVFDFAWLTNPGTPVFLSALISMVMLRMNLRQVRRVFALTCWQMRIPIPTIACMLGLSYVTRYAGLDATLGYAVSGTRKLYPFFAPILGWLGVFLTGTDAGSNALFGSLQKITATEIFKAGAFAHGGLALPQAQVLICTSNSTGGVMGKMIDAQSICVATAATDQVGREADIFKAVVWHSIALAVLVGIITLLQAYVFPFTLLVPGR
ncbi:MAG TPA: L-lactate permease [Gemmataceae bacterium]|nr:L-lactate permease [Gemmataceae bacterium]